jgi:hypothetical protein
MARSSKLPKSIAALATKHPDRVAEVRVEHDEFGGHGSPYSYWLDLKPGWWNANTETHAVHEINVREFMEAWRAVAPCACEQCQQQEQTVT